MAIITEPVLISLNETMQYYNETINDTEAVFRRRYNANFQVRVETDVGGIIPSPPGAEYGSLGVIILQSQFGSVVFKLNGDLWNMGLLKIPTTADLQAFATLSGCDTRYDNAGAHGKVVCIYSYDVFCEAEELQIDQTWARVEGDFGI